MAKPRQTVEIDFAMVDPEGTAPIRVMAGHAIRVGEAWQQLGHRMNELADSFDRLVNGGSDASETPDA